MNGLVPCSSGKCGGVTHHVIGSSAQINCGVSVDFSSQLASMKKISARLAGDGPEHTYANFEPEASDYGHYVKVYPALDTNYEQIWKMEMILPSKSRWEGTLPIPGRTSLDDPAPTKRQAIDAVLEDGDDRKRKFLIDLLLKGRAEKASGQPHVPIHKSNVEAIPKQSASLEMTKQDNYRSAYDRINNVGEKAQKRREESLKQIDDVHAEIAEKNQHRANQNARGSWVSKKSKTAVATGPAPLTALEEAELEAELQKFGKRVGEWSKGRAFGMFKPKEADKPKMEQWALDLIARKERAQASRLIEARVAAEKDPNNVEQKRQLAHAGERKMKIQQAADQVMDLRRLRMLTDQEQTEFKNLISGTLPQTLELHSDTLDVAVNDEGRKSALTELDEQLDYISGEVDRVLNVVQQRLSDRQRQHGNFLEDKFRRSTLDLPEGWNDTARSA